MCFRLAVGAALLCCFLAVGGQKLTGEISIEVRDPSGAPMEASGRLESLAGGVDRGFNTDARGTYTFRNVPSGRYRLEVSKSGFATQSALIDVQAGAATSRIVAMALAAAPASAVTVVGTTPLSPIQTATQLDIEKSGALDIADFLNRRFSGVYWNEVQGNPVQPDLNYRGYTASPLLGTPQGLSIYMDGVRLNQPFGDIVSWDLIPRIAISEVTLMPGSNPLFGLNTLGGALSIRTKDGRSQPGTALEISGGSFGRKMADLEHGGSNGKGLNWYLAGSLFFEDGWRDDSPSDVRQFFGKLGWQREKTSVAIAFAYANNALTGNGLQEQRFLARDYGSVYTKPDFTGNRSPFVNLTARHSPNSRLTLSGNASYRYIRSRTLNADINEDSLDEPDAAFNGLINRSNTKQHDYGLSGQMSWFASAGGHRNQLTAGAAHDRGRADFTQSTEFGYLTPDRGVTGVDVFADGARVDLNGRIHTGSVYANDTLSVGNAWNFTLSGRYNRTTVDNLDRILPGGGPGSLTGRNVFGRLNPAAGVTYQPVSSLSAYFGYSEGSRAPTSIELGCADPEQPCKLPNAMAGDPPLDQVVTRTFEARLRGGGQEGKVNWNAGWFRAENRNDILFVASEQTGFGYFKNFGKTLRQGVEIGANGRIGRFSVGGGYTYLDATFRSPEEVNGSGNSAEVDGIIGIEPGNRIPFIPRHALKAYADIQVTSKFLLDAGMLAISSSYARGNENNLHQPDGEYYLGPGTAPGYAAVNLGARDQVQRRLQLFVQINNVSDRRYYTAAQLGPTGFNNDGASVAWPFPVRQATFYAPGAPRSAWGGMRLTF